MRVVVTGATGNVGTALLRRISTARDSEDDPIDVVGVARRAPDLSAQPYAAATWVTCDVGESTSISTLIDAMQRRGCGRTPGLADHPLARRAGDAANQRPRLATGRDGDHLCRCPPPGAHVVRGRLLGGSVRAAGGRVVADGGDRVVDVQPAQVDRRAPSRHRRARQPRPGGDAGPSFADLPAGCRQRGRALLSRARSRCCRIAAAQAERRRSCRCQRAFGCKPCTRTMSPTP